MLFLYGFLAAAGVYLFCRFIAFIAPMGDPETRAGNQWDELREAKERANIKARLNTPKPPPPPAPKATTPPNA